jgi:ribosomal protein L40E
MSDYLEAMNERRGYRQATEHNFKRIIAGDVESVREQLVYALERLDYRVLSEQPLTAKRNGRVSSCSLDILECIKGLTISLKELNPTSTLVTFDYEILNSFVTKGDRQTIEKEAEAIIALAVAHPEATVCASCGTNNSSDSRFCRVCGTPNVAGEPAELEVLRLTAGGRSGYQSITGALISALVVAAIAVPIILLRAKGPRPGFILLIVGEIIALSWLLYGMWQLHRTLNPATDKKQTGHVRIPHAIPARERALLPQPGHASVTEGTTELLDVPQRERQPVPVNPHKVNTAEMR